MPRDIVAWLGFDPRTYRIREPADEVFHTPDVTGAGSEQPIRWVIRPGPDEPTP